ncbi:type II toxin-antitoxin system RelE/ParE family toxin [Sphingomonas kyeonggiensis]|uniref:type II toxin-antitoxin system RelE/ParE family toxin n=1 Tax=Sphingomonas kyeonggiensis TaxID=1268553 RepID=UPI0027D90ED8|nr:type II toxin-antitoxin system RelE/ParE family toxin [Sphingomonas kyeonggiensis]
MNRARWTPPAQDDLAALDDESSQLSPEYARRIGREALAAARFLAENPGAGPVVEGPVRKWRVLRTDYVLLYRIVAGGVEILRLHHAMRDWRPRRQ